MGTRGDYPTAKSPRGSKLNTWILLTILAFVLIFQHLPVATAELEGLDDEDYDEAEIIHKPAKPRAVPVRNSAAQSAEASTAKKTKPTKFKEFKDDPVDLSDAEETHFGKRKPSSGKAKEGKKVLRQIDEWDEEEFEGIPDKPVEDKFLPRRQELKGSKKRTEKQTNFFYEKVAMMVIAAYLLNYFVGRWTNRRIARAWANMYAEDEGIFARNFSLVGPGNPELEWEDTHLLKESQNEFRLYCSGRVCCEKMMATLLLKPRQDLFSYIMGLIRPLDDLIKFEVVLNVDAMDPSVVCLTSMKNAKIAISENADIKNFTTLVAPTADRRKPWVHPRVAVMAESYEVANDLLLDWMIENVFGVEAWPTVAPYFDSVHLTDQGESTTFAGQTKLLKFFFKLPPNRKMGAMAPLLELVCRTIDVVARHRLSPSALKKAHTARKMLQEKEFKKTLGDRVEAVQQKKMEKLEKEKEKEATMSKAALAKKEKKDAKLALKKQNPRMKLQKVK